MKLQLILYISVIILAIGFVGVMYKKTKDKGILLYSSILIPFAILISLFVPYVLNIIANAVYLNIK